MANRLAEFIRIRSEPLLIQYRVNAGYLPLTHWLHDPQQGGGRIVGEGCHFIDFLTFLVGASPLSVHAVALPDKEKYNHDNVILTLNYPDGSIGSVTYLANGNKNYAKERVEVFTSGRIAVLNDFRTLELVTEDRKTVTHSALRQDKGHANAWLGFLSALKNGGPPPIPYEQLISTSLASFAALESLRSGNRVDL